ERGGEAGSEELCPEAVDEGAGGERVVGAGEPVGEVESRGAAAGVGLLRTGQEMGRRGRDDLARLVLPVTAREHARDERLAGDRDDRECASVAARGDFAQVLPHGGALISEAGAGAE